MDPFDHHHATAGDNDPAIPTTTHLLPGPRVTSPLTLTPDTAVATLMKKVTGFGSTPFAATVTPDIAARLLGTVNLDASRTMNGANIHRMALAMRSGDFTPHSNLHDPLTLTRQGRLRNGKQRLVALILTGSTHIFTFCLHPEN